MHKKPLVSIITPSFNQGRFIESTIQSVLSQDYPCIEYIVMDGGSNDDTISILKKYDQEIIWFSEPDKGQSDAVNKGFTRARGEILGWLNSDDTYEPGAIRKVVEYFDNHPEAMMVYGEGNHINSAGEFIERYPTEPFNYDRLAETCYICQPTVFLRKTVIREVGLLDVDLHYCMDYDYWIRIGRKLTVHHINEHLANTRLYPDTKTLSKRVQAHAEILKTVKKHYVTVPPSWIYAYSHVFLEGKLPRRKKLQNRVFVLFLTFISLFKFVQQNGRIPSSEIKRMRTWITGVFPVLTFLKRLRRLI